MKTMITALGGSDALLIRALAEREGLLRRITEWQRRAALTADQMPGNVLHEEQKSNELVKLIRKLRWMRMEDEAKQVEKQLLLLQVPAADCVIATSRETD
jgi:hypothetical protein